MERLSGNLKNRKEGYGIGLPTVGIRAALQLYFFPPNLCITVVKKQDKGPKMESLMLNPPSAKPD